MHWNARRRLANLFLRFGSGGLSVNASRSRAAVTVGGVVALGAICALKRKRRSTETLDSVPDGSTFVSVLCLLVAFVALAHSCRLL